MNKEVLNNLAIGEKAADIQEYHWGKNGEKLVYKVTIYTCKSLLFGKYTSKYTFPFYFKTREFAEEFVQNHDKYEFKKFHLEDYCDTVHVHYKIYPKNVGFKKTKCEYSLVTASIADYNVALLEIGGIWDGFVECRNKRHNSCINYKKYYTKIDELENDAAIEGTSGKTFSYKLQIV